MYSSIGNAYLQVSPHKFRSIVATTLYNTGQLSQRDIDSVAKSMLTSSTILMRHYIRVHPSVDYTRAQDHLDSMLGKRRTRDEDGDEAKEEEEED